MKNMYNKLNPFSQKHDFLCQIFQAAMKFFSSTIPEFEFQKVHSNLITQIVPCPLLQHTYLSPQWCFSDFTWQLTNLVTSLVQIRGFCDDKTQFSTIPMERKVTEGSPQNVFSKLFYQYQMSSSLHGRSRPVPFLNSLSWFNAKTQQGCSARDSCLPVLLQHPGNRELLLRLCVLFPALSPTNSIFPASVWGPARYSPMGPHPPNTKYFICMLHLQWELLLSEAISIPQPPIACFVSLQGKHNFNHT